MFWPRIFSVTGVSKKILVNFGFRGGWRFNCGTGALRAFTGSKTLETGSPSNGFRKES